MPSSRTSQQTLWLRASPYGKKCGFVVFPLGEGASLSITILPKPWGPGRTHTRRVDCSIGEPTHITVHELDFIEVRGTSTQLGDLALSLPKVAGGSESQLLEQVPPPDVPPSRADDDRPVDAFQGVVDLLLLAERGGIRRTLESYGAMTSRSWMRVLSQARFVAALEPLIFNARPAYVENTERLASPRGRASDISVLQSIRYREPALVCTFDELTMNTPLLQVMLAALHLVAGDPPPRQIAALVPRITVRAVQISRHLATVELIGQALALKTALRLRLGPNQRRWAFALELAIVVLEEAAEVPSGPVSTDEAVAIHVRTEKFWEQTVEVILRSVFSGVAVSADNTAGPGVQTPFPWTETDGSDSTESYPDYLFRASGKVVVADAKYKRTTRLTSSDGYQLFAYSHLACLDEVRASSGAVFYPGLPNTIAQSRTLARRPMNDFVLRLVTLPFPGRGQVRVRNSWNRYLQSTAQTLQGLSGSWRQDEADVLESQARESA